MCHLTKKEEGKACLKLTLGTQQASERTQEGISGILKNTHLSPFCLFLFHHLNKILKCKREIGMEILELEVLFCCYVKISEMNKERCVKIIYFIKFNNLNLCFGHFYALVLYIYYSNEKSVVWNKYIYILLKIVLFYAVYFDYGFLPAPLWPSPLCLPSKSTHILSLIRNGIMKFSGETWW